MGSNWICELSCRKRTLGVCRDDLLLPGVDTAGDRVRDLRADLDILKGDSLTRGLLNARGTSSVLLSDS